MKKFITALMSAVMVLATTTLAFADTAHVTISNGQGDIVVAYEDVDLTEADTDGDGVYTINEVLAKAHALYSANGSDDYATAEGDYGLYISLLWGIDAGGAYGYAVNNVLASGLTDTVVDGDYVYAYIYSDTTSYSDVFAYFEEASATVKETEQITVTLYAVVYDENWTPVAQPLENATITINGTASEYVTDANGQVTLAFEEEGTYEISATSDEMTLVPALELVTVEVNQVIVSDSEESKTPAVLTATKIVALVVAIVAVVLLVLVVVLVLKKKKNK